MGEKNDIKKEQKKNVISHKILPQLAIKIKSNYVQNSCENANSHNFMLKLKKKYAKCHCYFIHQNAE